MIAALALLLSLTAQEPPTLLVGRLWEQYGIAATRGDFNAAAEFFAEDALLMVPGADEVAGRGTIRLLLKTMFARPTRTVDIRFMPREVRQHDTVIYDRGDYIETLAITGYPRTATDYYGRYVGTWTFQPDGTWRLSRLMLAPRKQPQQ